MTAIGVQVARGARGAQSRGTAYHREDWGPSVTEALGQGDNSPRCPVLAGNPPPPAPGKVSLRVIWGYLLPSAARFLQSSWPLGALEAIKLSAGSSVNDL